MAGWVTGGYPGGSVNKMSGDSFAWKQSICKLVLHSTETAGFPNYPYNKAPNVTVNPKARRWQQHQSLDKPSWALQAGTVSTNSMGAIQIEIVGYAATLKDISGDDLDYLLGFIRFILDQTGIPIQCSVLFGGPETSGVNGTRRLSSAAWAAYRGILGHQHVPGNSHWDPGDIPMQAVWLPRLQGTSPAPTPEPEPPIEKRNDDMYLIQGPTRGIAVIGAGWYNGPTIEEVYALQRAGVPGPVAVSDADFDRALSAVTHGTSAPVKATVDTSGIVANVSDADKAEIANQAAVKTVAAMPKTLS